MLLVTLKLAVAKFAHQNSYFQIAFTSAPIFGEAFRSVVVTIDYCDCPFVHAPLFSRNPSPGVRGPTFIIRVLSRTVSTVVKFPSEKQLTKFWRPLLGICSIVYRNPGKNPQVIPTMIPKLDLDRLATIQLQAHFSRQINIIMFREATIYAQHFLRDFRDIVNTEIADIVEELEAGLDIDENKKTDLDEKSQHLTSLLKTFAKMQLDATTKTAKFKDEVIKPTSTFSVGPLKFKTIAVIGEGGEGSAYLVCISIIRPSCFCHFATATI